MTTPATDPLALDRFTVHYDVMTSHVVIADRDRTPLTGDVADRILGDRESSVIWNTDDRLGYIVFKPTEKGWAMAVTLADQLNDLDAQADAAQADALIDDAASLAERIEAEAEATDGLTAGQRRGLAAYQRAASLPLYPYGEGCGEQFHVGDRVQIGDPADPYYAGALAGVGLYATVLGKTGTVILPQSPTCPLIVLLDSDDPIALPHPSLYVRRAGGAA